MFLYVCGGTIQGNYTTAFVLARQPHITLPETKAAMSTIAASIGMHMPDFCTNNNTCFDN